MPADSILIEDPVLLASIRASLGGGLITEESLSEIHVLRLDELPSSWNELDLLSNLETLEINQSAIDSSSSLPFDRFQIVLIGGELP